MNKTIYNFLMLLFIGSFGLIAQTQKKYQKSFSVNEKTRLSFDTQNIDVTFKTWDKDEVKILEIDLALSRNKKITERNHAIEDRRAETYGEILDL